MIGNLVQTYQPEARGAGQAALPAFKKASFSTERREHGGLWRYATAYDRAANWRGCFFAILATAVTIGFRVAIDSSLEGKTTLVLFIMPIILSAYCGGASAGLLATGLSGLWGFLHLISVKGFWGVPSSSWWNLAFFLISGVSISLLSGALHYARQQAERAYRGRRQIEERLQVAFRDTMDLRAALDEHAIVSMLDQQGRLTFANDKFCAISGYARERLLGHDYRIVCSDYHPKEFVETLWRTISEGHVWQGEIKQVAKNRAHYWIAATIMPFRTEEGQPWQYISIGTDITERKNAEAAAAHLAAIVEYSEDAIISADLNGLVVTWNAGAQKILGYRPEEMIGRPTFAFIPPERHAEEAGLLARIRRGENVRGLDTVRMRKDGSMVDVSVTVSAIKNTAGHIIGTSKVFRDIADRKKAEAEIVHLNANLEIRVAQRTAELESANKELEAFSYSVSHDLRAPLRTVDGFSQAVLEDYGDRLPEEGRRYLRTIRQGAQQMGTLIDDLLTFSRFSRAPLKKEPLQPATLVSGVWADLATYREGRRIDFRLGPLPPCEGDCALLREVWLNLLSNAVKYTRKRGQAVVEVGSENSPEGPVYYVRDNGAGFDMRFKDQLFGVFQRLHCAEEFEGTGVGLALVQRIVVRHGGRVWAEAEPDRGATFFFTLQGGDK